MFEAVQLFQTLNADVAGKPVNVETQIQDVLINYCSFLFQTFML